MPLTVIPTAGILVNFPVGRIASTCRDPFKIVLLSGIKLDTGSTHITRAACSSVYQLVRSPINSLVDKQNFQALLLATHINKAKKLTLANHPLCLVNMKMSIVQRFSTRAWKFLPACIGLKDSLWEFSLYHRPVASLAMFPAKRWVENVPHAAPRTRVGCPQTSAIP